MGKAEALVSHMRRPIALPTTTEKHAASPSALDHLAVITTIVRLLRDGADLAGNVERALEALMGALQLSSTQIVRLDGEIAHPIITAGVAHDPPNVTDPALVLSSTTARSIQVDGAQVLSFRLTEDGETAWVLGCRRDLPAPFAPAEIQLVEVLAGIFAGCVDHLRLLADLRDAEEDALRALAASLASRDRYTGSHVDAVSIYAERLGQRLGLSEQELRDLRMGSLLHDIGKIGVADTILQKNGPLTDFEMMQMRQHPTIGAQIVRQVRRLQPAMPVVLYHHERWDGKGYPSGLAGEHIPIGARIVAVADSFHAMTSTRPYRPARSNAEALAELRRGAGSHFDPEIVAAFIDLLNDAEAGRVPKGP